MKHALLALFIGLVSAINAHAQSATVHYPVTGPFVAVKVHSAFNVKVSDQVSDVVVTIDQKAQPKVVVKVEDGILTIGVKGPTRYKGKAVAVIPAPEHLYGVNLSGASSFRGNLAGELVKVILSGASTFVGNIDADELKVEASGASTLKADGACGDMKMTVSGASSILAGNLLADTVKGEVSGASHVDISCASLLKVEASGASHVSYHPAAGSTPQVNCVTSGASTVKAK